MENLEQFSSVVIKSEPNGDHTIMAYIKNRVKIENEIDTAKLETDSKCIKREIEDNGMLEIKQEEIIIKDEPPPFVPDVSSDFENVESITDTAAPLTYAGTKSAFKGQIVSLGKSPEIQNSASTKKKQFFCNICEYKTSWKSYFKRHMKTHTAEMPFSCNLCEFKNAGKSASNIHMKTHPEERPFPCNLCGYKSSQKNSLKCHMKTHAEEKLFSCNLCEFKTVWKSNLRRHMKTYAEVKRFSCNLCEFKTARKSALNIHIRTHTK